MRQPGHASVRFRQQRIKRRTVSLPCHRNRCLQFLQQHRQTLTKLKIAGLPAKQ